MRILVVDDAATARYAMAKCLRSAGREIVEADDGVAAIDRIREHVPDLVFLDLNLPKLDGLGVLKALADTPLQSKPEIIVVTANDTVSHAVQCIRLGASDFITKPYDVDHLRAIAQRSEERVKLQARLLELQNQIETGSQTQFGAMLGTSHVMQQVFTQITRAARVSLPVLVRGESGTGKELVARELHVRSERASRAFIAVNTAAIPDTLVESELFGHVKGAFTGAERSREGVFRQADGGTLFLDEIGDMPAGVQTRLLRVLQESVVQPVGSEELIPVDVRVISATHQDLEQAISEKLFRQDLYFRLRGIELQLPSLRARREDILPLAQAFLMESILGGHAQFTNDAIAALLGYLWPGNIRELKQRVLSAAAMCEGQFINAVDLGLAASHDKSQPQDPFAAYYDLPLSEGRTQILSDFETAAIRRALSAEEGNVSAAARRLGIHRQSLQQKLKALGLHAE